jgi:hypothetical protein
LGPLRLIFGTELRRRWRSWLVLALLVAFVGGFAMAAAAAGRRTASAFPSFVATHGYDGLVYNLRPAPALAKLPAVASATEVRLVLSGQPTCACTHPINTADFVVVAISPQGLSRAVKLVSGHMPDQSAPDQVLASFTLQQDDGVRVGTVVHVPFYSSRQGAPAVLSATGGPPVPKGPTVALRVVGIEAAESEFPSGGTPTYDLYTTPAFARTIIPKTAFSFAYLVRLRHGGADLPRFEAQVQPLNLLGEADYDGAASSVEASIHPQAVGWWVLAALAALAGMAVIGQALGRQSSVESEHYPTLSALGSDRPQLVALGTVRNLAIGLAGAAGAIALAFALSPLTPVGEARLAEPSTGFSFDGLVLPLGVVVTVVVVLLLGTWPVARSARVRAGESRGGRARASSVVAFLADSGAPPSAVIGARHALERGQGRASVPVATALLGAVLALITLCATSVFGASLLHLTTTPALYGESYGAMLFGSPTGGNVQATTALVGKLEHDRAITRITLAFSNEVVINKLPVLAISGTPLRGQVLLSVVRGKFPDGAAQVALGAVTMRQVGAHLGSFVAVTVETPTGRAQTTRSQVVGTVSFPSGTNTGNLGLGTGAAFSLTSYLNAVCPPGPAQAGCRSLAYQQLTPAVLVAAIAGPRGQADINHYLSSYQSSLSPIVPTSLVNFGEAVNFPLIVGGMLALFGAATLVHLLVISVARRGRELSLLKALGFVNGQVAAVVRWQATTVALVGIALGVPLGVVVGRAVWHAFANNLGVVPVTVVQPWLLCALAAGALVVANLLAIIPGLIAAKSKPGRHLRAR